jgi:hypothetical protein
MAAHGAFSAFAITCISMKVFAPLIVSLALSRATIAREGRGV